MWKVIAAVTLLLTVQVTVQVPAANADVVVMRSADCERLIPNETPHQVLSVGECIVHFLDRKPAPFVFRDESVIGVALYRLLFGDLRFWALAGVALVLGSATVWLIRRRSRSV